MKLSVIIPVYNEKSTIKKIVDLVLAEKTPKEIIIIDDGSTDGTKEIIKKIKNNKVVKIFQSLNKGKGSAIRAGIEKAKGDILIIQDADLEYDPKDYQKLIKPIIAGETSVVYGSRLAKLNFKLFGKNKTPLPLHFVCNKILTGITNFLYGSKLSDMETCYKVISKEVYQNLDLKSDRFDIEPEITAKILKKRYKILEIPITVKPRNYKEGKKIKTKDALLALVSLIKNKFS